MTIDQLVIFLAGGLVVGGAVQMLNTLSHMRASIADLKRQNEQAQADKAKAEHDRERPAPGWGESLRLDHRAQLASIATLSELALSDLLDATIRLSPEAARRAVEKHAPQLFTKEIK